MKTEIDENGIATIGELKLLPDESRTVWVRANSWVTWRKGTLFNIRGKGLSLQVRGYEVNIELVVIKPFDTVRPVE